MDNQLNKIQNIFIKNSKNIYIKYLVFILMIIINRILNNFKLINNKLI